MEGAISVAKCHFEVQCEIQPPILSSNQESNGGFQEPKWKKIAQLLMVAGALARMKVEKFTLSQTMIQLDYFPTWFLKCVLVCNFI
jgi:hypothetical protein